MTKKTSGEIGTDVSEIAGAAKRAASPVPRALADMEPLVYPGAREVATLTVAARSLDWQFEPVMYALEIASKITDWSHPFMVAQRVKGDKFGPSFNWKDAPYRRYKSFEHFYANELEQTFGTWENLQRTWGEVVKGKITEDEGRRIILHGHGGDRRSEKTRFQSDNQDDVITLKERGTSRAYVLARLDRDRPDLAAKVRAKTISANAAAIEAGFWKKVERRKITIIDRLLRLWAKATDDERAAFRTKIDEP
jgi:hypothetical protein